MEILEWYSQVVAHSFILFLGDWKFYFLVMEILEWYSQVVAHSLPSGPMRSRSLPCTRLKLESTMNVGFLTGIGSRSTMSRSSFRIFNESCVMALAAFW